MKKFNTFIIIILFGFLSGCAENSIANTASPTTGEIYGFLTGFWHGFTIIFQFIASLFGSSSIYESHSNGWYNFGYILGIYCTFNSSKTVYKYTNDPNKNGLEVE